MLVQAELQKTRSRTRLRPLYTWVSFMIEGTEQPVQYREPHHGMDIQKNKNWPFPILSPYKHHIQVDGKGTGCQFPFSLCSVQPNLFLLFTVVSWSKPLFSSILLCVFLYPKEHNLAISCLSQD